TTSRAQPPVMVPSLLLVTHRGEVVMKRSMVLCTLMLFTTLTLLSACSSRVVERETVKESPPVTVVRPPEVVMVQPQRSAVWVPGHWVQSGYGLEWRSGHWE